MLNLFKKGSKKDSNCCNVVIEEVVENDGNKVESKNCCTSENEKENGN